MPPPTIASNNVGNEELFNRIPLPTIDKRTQDKLDRVEKLESRLRTNKGVDDYVLDLEALMKLI